MCSALRIACCSVGGAAWAAAGSSRQTPASSRAVRSAGTRAGYARERVDPGDSLGRMGVLIYGDSVRSPALRHEVPVAIIDPFLYLEENGTRAVVASALERPRLEGAGDLELIGLEDLGWDELIGSGRPRWDIELEVATRAADRFGLTAA